MQAGFPRDLSVHAAWRGTGPRPTKKYAVLRPVARGPVPRDRWSARGMNDGEGQALALR